MEASFDNDRLNAAKAFAQTMIVVDDEAGDRLSDTGDVQKSTLVEPGRQDAKITSESQPEKKVERDLHPLNQKKLVDRALELGLVCAVVRPGKNEDVVKKVTKVAERADIVSLDWEMHDDGESARSIINKIVDRDKKNGGRLRLIAIYTGVNDREKIYADILRSFPERIRNNHNVRLENNHIVSDNGLRIVWLFKGDGIQLTGESASFQVKEDALAERLQMEFSELSEGLLSNVALATIAAVRDSTHHVLGKFSGKMDGPFFHHRAFLKYPADAEDYSVSVVLSELKNAVDKTRVASKFAGAVQISNRIRHLIADGADLKLKTDNADHKKFSEKDVVSLVCEGWLSLDQTRPPRNFGIKKVKADFSSIFENSQEAGRREMMAFASLTGTKSHPGNYLDGKNPQLALGSVIHSEDTGYLLCLQANCDTVPTGDSRGFYFVKLTKNDENDKDDKNPDHVVPVIDESGSISFLGLCLVKSAYTKSVSLIFPPAGTTAQAQSSSDYRRYYFKDIDKKEYIWVANLKERRAMRTVQWVGNEMGRIGFNEFEPFRSGPK